MTQKELFDKISAQISAIYGTDEARAITFSLFEELASRPRHSIVLNPDELLDNPERLLAAADEIAASRPLQYVVGRGWFCDMAFEVDENVLIPRPETEELVKIIVEDNSGRDGLQLLDIGTGSGCIAISLAKFIENSRVSAIDISEKALEIAQRNAKSNGAKVEFSKVDILAQTPQGRYNIIVSNPPYVTNSEKTLMRPNVLDHEPHLALFVYDNDPLLFYRRITQLATQLLNPEGRLYFEINEKFGEEVAVLMRKEGFEQVEIKNDIFDKPRFVQGVWR